MKTYYSNINKKKLCNRNNGELKTLPRFDFQMQDYFSVTFIDSLNKIIDIDPTDQFYIAGGLDVMKDSENLLFYSEDFTLENNKLTFTIDTYTDNYLKHIKNTNTPIYLEIGIINEKKTILLQDTVLAEPRVYLDGVAPTNIEVFYTKAQIDEKLAAVKIEQTDPIYTADKPTLALKSELFSKSYNDLTDKPTNIQELGITITSDDIVSMYSGNEYSITEEFQYIEETTTNNLIDYVNEQKYIKTIDGSQADDEGNFDLANFGYISVNNIGDYITGYTETDPIYTADKAKLALKTEIPSGLSELENDAGYITSAAVKSTIGISEEGSETKYLNEKGQFVQVESSGSDGSTGLTKWGTWQDISTETEYTAETNGWIFVNRTMMADLDTYVQLVVDGETVFENTQNISDLVGFIGEGLYVGIKTSMIVPVFAGQTYIINGHGIYCRFAPCV